MNRRAAIAVCVPLLTPSRPGAIPHLDAGCADDPQFGALWRTDWPNCLLEVLGCLWGYETRALRVDVAITQSALLVNIETMRNHEMQVVLGARHCHVQKTALFIDVGLAPSAEVGRDATIHHIEDEYARLLLSLGGMNCGKDQVVLVQQGWTGLVTGCCGRIECDFR